jgi:hypothetical protein
MVPLKPSKRVIKDDEEENAIKKKLRARVKPDVKADAKQQAK